MLEKIKEEADVLYNDYSMLLKCFENSSETKQLVEVEENIKKHIISLYAMVKVFNLPEKLILAAAKSKHNIESIEEFSEKMSQTLNFHKESYELYLEALPKTKTV